MDSSLNQHLIAVLKHFDTTMLVTQSKDITHARPMAIAELGSDAHMHFVTRGDSETVAEIVATPAVTLICQSSRQFATLSGRAMIAKDSALVERLWKDAWKVWFPLGKTDPNIAMIRFDAEQGEYWDNAGAQGIKYLFRAAKSYVTGDSPETDAQQHAKLQL